MWHIFTMEYYSTRKINELINFSGKWMELEKVILTEIIQTQKYQCNMLGYWGDPSSKSSDVNI